MAQRASAREDGGISLRSVQRIWAAHALDRTPPALPVRYDSDLGVRAVAAEGLGRAW